MGMVPLRSCRLHITTDMQRDLLGPSRVFELISNFDLSLQDLHGYVFTNLDEWETMASELYHQLS